MNVFFVLIAWDKTTEDSIGYPQAQTLFAVTAGQPNWKTAWQEAAIPWASAVMVDPAYCYYERYDDVATGNAITVTHYTSKADYLAMVEKHKDLANAAEQARSDLATVLGVSVTEKRATLEAARLHEMDYAQVRKLFNSLAPLP